MLANKKNNNIRGSAFFEYATIFSLVAAVLFTMNAYVKRGIQARTKDLSDEFFSAGKEEQVEELDPESQTHTTVPTDAESSLHSEAFTGGGTKYSLSGEDDVSIDSVTKTPRVPDNNFDLIPSDEGEVPIDPHPKDTYANDDNMDELNALANETGNKDIANLVDAINGKKNEWDTQVAPYMGQEPTIEVSGTPEVDGEYKLPRIKNVRQFDDEKLNDVWNLTILFKRQEEKKLANATDDKTRKAAQAQIDRANRFQGRLEKEYARRGLSVPPEPPEEL